METAVAILVGVMISSGIYLMLSRILLRFVFGLIIISNAVNLLLFTSGRLTRLAPPLIPEEQTLLTGHAANAVPQALILTAIVIGFALLSFILVLYYKTFQKTGVVDTEIMGPESLDEEAS
jgi:multicomponent Na+:H+ antiporter subunit C